MSKLLPIFGTAMLLCACEARIGNDAPPVAENASAAGRAEDGRLTVEAPGFNLSIDIPEGIRGHTNMDDENGLIYPGSTFGGIHVQGGPERANGESDGEVEIRFTTGDATDRVVAWYRDPARGEDLTIQSARQEGSGFVIVGNGRHEHDRFTLRVGPRAGGGTEGRLVLTDRNQ